MHVLITADTLGGVWIYARELVRGLLQEGVRVTLVSFGNLPDAAQRNWIDDCLALHTGFDFRPTGFKLEWMRDAMQDLAESAAFLREVIDETRPDLLHLNQYYYGDLHCYHDVPRIVVAHSDVVSWWVAVHSAEPPASDWIDGYRKLVARGLRGATAIVALSRWMLEQIGKHYGNFANSAVIHNGRSAKLFQPSITKSDYVLSVGRLWDAGKQVHLLLQSDSDTPVHLAGAVRGPDSCITADTAKKSNVIFHGLQSELQLSGLYARAPIYAATSRYEPFGLSPLEAALSHCAIVANDIPTFHELWGESVYYFRANDGASLAKAIEYLQKTPELRADFADRGYRHALLHYTAERMVAEYIALYRDVLAHNKFKNTQNHQLAPTG